MTNEASQVGLEPQTTQGKLFMELAEAKQLVLNLFSQACSETTEDGTQYDHMCLSTYEHAQDKLIEWGLVSKDQCVRE